jgi:hypothetical protein
VLTLFCCEGFSLLCIGVAPFWLFVFAFTKNLPIGAAPFNLFLHNYNDITHER